MHTRIPSWWKWKSQEARVNVLVLKAIPAGEIHGSVTLPDGNPVPYANVYADTEDYAAYAYAETDENGNFILAGLADGIWIVYAIPPYEDKAYNT